MSQRISFTKLEGTGNDFIFIEDLDDRIKNYDQLSMAMTDRHFGIGGDGVILVLKSKIADTRMRVFNADGSEGEMCGNGIRCFAKYVRDRSLVNREQTSIKIETKAGIKIAEFMDESQPRTTNVKIDMGKPLLIEPSTEHNLFTDIQIDGTSYPAILVSMGNPHAVIFVDSFDFDYCQLASKIENLPMFPHKTNVEFIRPRSRTEIDFRVWERGSGETLACGTGACAAVVACILSGKTGDQVIVHLRGGPLEIAWPNRESIFMTGAATEVFSGEYVFSQPNQKM
eukprot:TRINITY_DN1095_c0_g1_i1.p1 TRINITY_DN1095_c0_g1~~TRINITY_DN1095_c0_g1_i1.p1  ORF type:complete len:284 (+),score=62.62 TRINITY_DN1095_c0_g1_i1:48-899(+)